eukprot:CAMPEP_0198552392 /NCGR_PEP_ID=MMETSP1462-20131121/78512_1 /TAXON_ID=1333877 /ORGANISM="Brandtodinium nutriculum, Strain RCC3387" /LENGTH=81 /DNA_ID=CAMNT_0044283049 /DNA_START=24 /DNA_END=265 /DNA_ORIENTATION=-
MWAAGTPEGLNIYKSQAEQEESGSPKIVVDAADMQTCTHDATKGTFVLTSSKTKTTIRVDQQDIELWFAYFDKLTNDRGGV